jgi:putative oxidoreductase
VGGLFLFAGVMKLVGHPMMVQEFETVGLGQWFRYLTGLLELAGGVAVLVPSISGLGALVLLVVDVGEFIAQIGALHMAWIHPIVIGAVLVRLVYLQRDQIRARLGL